MKKIHNFKSFIINEQLKESTGYGEEPFFFAKDGDVFNYFFKIEHDNTHRSFVISIGKFSQYTQPTEPKTDYGVLSITELNEDELDQAVTDKGQFDLNTKSIDVDNNVLAELMRTLTIIVKDYLQNNAKVNKFYDEIQDKIKSELYEDNIKNSVAGWPGEWNFQEIEKGKLNLISK